MTGDLRELLNREIKDLREIANFWESAEFGASDTSRWVAIAIKDAIHHLERILQEAKE